jgi:hypothetical protein
VGIYRATSSSLCLTGTELLAITFNIQSCTAKREIGPPTFRRFSCWINHSKLILFSFNKFCVLYRYLAETFYFDWFDFSWTLTLSIHLMLINLISLSGNCVIKKNLHWWFISDFIYVWYGVQKVFKSVFNLKIY